MFVDPGPPRDDGRWEALLNDLFLPPLRSDWTRRVTDERIKTTDRVRPFVARGLLLLGMACLLAVMSDVSWVAWVLLVPSAVQIFLELYLEERMRASVQDLSGLGPLKPLVTFWYRMYEKLPFNATGILGAAAVVCNLVATVFFTGPNNSGVSKVVLFVFALVYGNSGILGTLLDTPWFSPREKIVPVVKRVYPFFWVLAILLAVGLVWLGEAMGRWPTGSLEFAMMACALPYYIGLRVRDYSRALYATAQVLVMADLDARADLAMEMHNRLQIAKDGLGVMISRSNLEPKHRVALTAFQLDIEELYAEAKSRKANPRNTLHRPFELRVRRILDGSGLRYRDSHFGLDGRLDEDNYDLANHILTNFVKNAQQAHVRRSARDRGSSMITINMDVQDEVATIAVTDDLGPLPDDALESRTTLAYLRHQLRSRGGDMVEELHGNGWKTLTARWSTALPALRTADPNGEPS